MIETRTITLEIPIPEPAALEYGLWALVAIALVADIATTHVGLQAGLAESNPFARAVIHADGMAGMFGLKAGAITVGLFCRPLLEREYRSIVPAGLAVPWLAAAAVNCYMMAQVGVLF